MNPESSRVCPARVVPALHEFTPHATPGLSNVETPLVAWMIHHLDRANGDIHLAIVYMQADLKKRGTR